jgi:putative ABC transport system permease protein
MPTSQGAPAVYRDFAIRTNGNAATAKAQLLAAVRDIDPQVTPTPPRTLEERIAEQMAPQRLGATILGTLGAVALLLTLLGTYVLAEAMASSRTREMGIRAALGATRLQVGGIVITETGRLVGGGLLAGLALAWIATRIIRSFLFQVGPLDPATLAAVVGGILVPALAVSLRAAIRVASLDLAQVLRAE